MKIIIKAKNLELTAKLKAYIENRIGSLKKFIKILQEDESLSDFKRKTLAEVYVEVKRQTLHHKKGDVFLAEAIINLPGKKLVAKSHGEDVEKIIIKVKDELQQEIKKYKTKTIERPRRQAKKAKLMI